MTVSSAVVDEGRIPPNRVSRFLEELVAYCQQEVQPGKKGNNGQSCVISWGLRLCSSCVRLIPQVSSPTTFSGRAGRRNLFVTFTQFSAKYVATNGSAVTNAGTPI
jgi:hypothetical protein